MVVVRPFEAASEPCRLVDSNAAAAVAVVGLKDRSGWASCAAVALAAEMST